VRRDAPCGVPFANGGSGEASFGSSSGETSRFGVLSAADRVIARHTDSTAARLTAFASMTIASVYLQAALFAVFAVLAVLCAGEAWRRLIRRSDELRRKDELP
jgi:hypothetical protein